MKVEKHMNMSKVQPPPVQSGRGSGSLWSREKTCHLIELYKKNECLWNHWHEAYKNKDKRSRAIENICSSLQITKFDFGKKIHNLRNQFNTEMKKLEQRMEEAGGEAVNEDAGIRCKWSHFESLMFLRNVIEPRPGGYQSSIQPPKKMRLRFDYNSAEDDVNVTMLPVANTNEAAVSNEDISHYAFDDNNEETASEDFQNLENELTEVVGHSTQQREETVDQKYLPPIQQQQQHISTTRSHTQKKSSQTGYQQSSTSTSVCSSGVGHTEVINLNHDHSSIIELNSNNLAVVTTNPALISSSTTSSNTPSSYSASTVVSTPIISSVASAHNSKVLTMSSPSIQAPPQRDQWDSFGELVATEFRNLNSDISRKRLKRKIMQAMLEVGEEDDCL